MTSVRFHALARIGYGSALLCCAPVMVRVLHAPRDDKWALVVARVLGARHLAQAAITLAAPSRNVVIAGSIVDALHGASGVAMSVADARWRRAAATDAAVALTSAGFSWLGLCRRTEG